MSIPFSGTYSRSGGPVAAIAKHLKSVSLKPVKRITVTFDPFRENVRHTRDFLYYISSNRIARTNPSCSIRTEIVCDRREPTVGVKLTPEFANKFGSEEVVFRSDHLTCVELIQLLNKYVSSLAPEEKSEPETGTKLGKKARR